MDMVIKKKLFKSLKGKLILSKAIGVGHLRQLAHIALGKNA
jgi:hypothetical protein